jgi:hypothetical protein
MNLQIPMNQGKTASPQILSCALMNMSIVPPSGLRKLINISKYSNSVILGTRH